MTDLQLPAFVTGGSPVPAGGERSFFVGSVFAGLLGIDGSLVSGLISVPPKGRSALAGACALRGSSGLVAVVRSSFRPQADSDSPRAPAARSAEYLRFMRPPLAVTRTRYDRGGEREF